MALTFPSPKNPQIVGIACILFGMSAISVNDMLIKLLSGGYPLHQMVFIRSAIGIIFSLMLVQLEGGFGILKTKTPFLHMLRGVMLVTANMTFFAALAVLTLAETTALFYVSPLLITLLSIPILGEKIGRMRLSAVAVGFLGVLIMVQPWNVGGERTASLWIYALPVIGAATYALNQVLTRKLGVAAKASAMAVYIQSAFIVVSIGFFVVAGDGRYAAISDNQSLVFLLRAWVWPSNSDWVLFGFLGANATLIGYSITQAYRMAQAATLSPFEYIGLPLAIFWGWLFWGDLPNIWVYLGSALVVGSGLFVFIRERQRARVNLRVSRISRR